jgi:hypothetical protein
VEGKFYVWTRKEVMEMAEVDFMDLQTFVRS